MISKTYLHDGDVSVTSRILQKAILQSVPRRAKMAVMAAGQFCFFWRSSGDNTKRQIRKVDLPGRDNANAIGEPK